MSTSTMTASSVCEQESAPVAQSGALSLSGLCKSYNNLRVVDDVSLELRPGEFVSLLGPSGSGKTTTLRIVAGFIKAEAGVVTLDGRDLTGVPPHKRDIGMVFQNYALFPHMTAAENIGFPLAMRRQPKAAIRERVEEMLRLVHLEGLGNRYPGQLSGGQQQRVALARALSFRPGVLLMDEPLGALDKKLREALQLEIMRISRQLNITVLYVTHDQAESLVLSDRIAIFNEGRIEQIGSGEDLYERPLSLFVADFVGESNILRGVIADNAEEQVRLASGASVRVSQRACRRVGLSGGARAAVVIRPERMAVRPAQGEDDGAASDSELAADLPGKLREVVYLGSERKYVVELAGGEVVTVRVQEGTAEPLTCSGVRVCWKANDCVVVADPTLADAGSASLSAVKPGGEATEGGE